MPSHAPRPSVPRLVAVLVAALCGVADADAARPSTEGPGEPRSNGGPGDLAVADLEVFELAASGATRRHLVRATVENRSKFDLDDRWRIVISRDAEGESIGECVGESLPRERVGVCETWLPGGVVHEGDVIVARLDRGIDPYDAWDGEPTNDERGLRVRTIPTGGQVLRVAGFDVQPRVLHGPGEARFRFTIEGGHLAWLLVGREAPRLLAGHPADGIVSGASGVRIAKSGPVTLVARNSLGAFVYVTVPVLNLLDRRRASRGEDELAPPPAAPAPGRVIVLPAGVFDVDENLAVLERLARDLGQRDWSSTFEELRRDAERDREAARPGSVVPPDGRPNRD